jgi:hypothetical protein
MAKAIFRVQKVSPHHNLEDDKGSGGVNMGRAGRTSVPHHERGGVGHTGMHSTSKHGTESGILPGGRKTHPMPHSASAHGMSPENHIAHHFGAKGSTHHVGAHAKEKNHPHNLPKAFGRGPVGEEDWFMQSRHAQPEDFLSGGFDKLIQGNIGHDVRLSQDKIVVTGPVGSPSGCLVWRPGAIIHELYCGSGLNQRAIAQSLLDGARNHARTSVFRPVEALFVVHPANLRMLAYVEEIEAQEQKGNLYIARIWWQTIYRWYVAFSVATTEGVSPRHKIQLSVSLPK